MAERRRSDTSGVAGAPDLFPDAAAFKPQHFLYFLPLPQEQGSFRPAFIVRGPTLYQGMKFRLLTGNL